jgi:hypothetical protein
LLAALDGWSRGRGSSITDAERSAAFEALSATLRENTDRSSFRINSIPVLLERGAAQGRVEARLDPPPPVDVLFM